MLQYVYLHDSKRLELLINKTYGLKQYYPKLIEMINKNIPDNKIYANLHKLYHKKKIETPSESFRGKARIRDIEIMLGKNKKFKKYLDFGTNDGEITEEIGGYFTTSLKNVYGIDVKDSMDPNTNYSKKFNFQFYDGYKIPFPDQTFDLITSFQVLHHIPHYKKMLKEIYRVLKPNGVFIIREHDVKSKIDAYIINIQHFLYGLVVYKDVYSDFYNEYKGYYTNKKSLLSLTKKIGFDMYKIKKQVIKYNSPDKIYYIVLSRK